MNLCNLLLAKLPESSFTKRHP